MQPGTWQIPDHEGAFSATVLEGAQPPGRLVLFAAGRGGNPLRHLPLLQSLAARGCTVIAPHDELLGAPAPGKAELDRRIRRLEACAEACQAPDLPVVGIGHSIGTVALLALAGAQAHTRAGEALRAGARTVRLHRLGLMAPPADFFRLPGALQAVRLPLRIWAAGQDTITPPADARFLQQALAAQVPVEISLDAQAGHFSYMDELPPNVSDVHPDRRAFLDALARDVGAFLMS